MAKYTGYPIPKIVWRDIRGNEIPWSLSEDKSRKYEATKDDKTTTFKIRNPKIGDSGFYILHGDNGQKQEEKKFQLLVKGKPFCHFFTFLAFLAFFYFNRDESSLKINFDFN